MPLSAEKKAVFFEKLQDLLRTHNKVLVVDVDNVGSKQMQQIRAALRGQATVLMGKNTLIRKIFRSFLEDNPGHPAEALLCKVKGNVGFVFTNGDLSEVRKTLEENVVPAPARVGAIAPVDVIVPAGPTGCDPGQTSFFQTLQIATKITKGQIEITGDVHLIAVGDKVGNSEAELLSKLSIAPFSYGLVVQCVYDNGSIFDAKVLDMTDDDIKAKFSASLSNIASISLALGYPTMASLPHSIANAFKTLVAIAVECDEFCFEKAAAYKAIACPAPAPEPEAAAEEPAAAAEEPAAAAADY